MYKVLWFDDEYKKFDGFIEKANNIGLDIKGVESFEEGMNELKKNYKEYDVILLDAYFLENKENTSTNSTTPLHKAQNEIRNFKNKKFEFFVFTSKAKDKIKFNHLKESIEINNDSIKRLYKKEIPSDFKLLLFALKEAAERQPDFEVEQRHKRVFEIIDKYFSSAYKTILTLTKEIDEGEITKPEQALTAYRSQVYEKMISTLCDFELLPEGLRGKLNPAVDFLFNKHLKYRIETKFPVIHKTIKFILKNFVDIINDASHNNETLNYETVDYINNSKDSNNYLIKSTHYQLFELIIWLGDFLDENPCKEINRQKWTERNTNFEAIVKLYENNKFGVTYNDENYFLQPGENRLEQGQKALIKNFVPNTNSFDNIFSFFVGKDNYKILDQKRKLVKKARE